MLKSSLDVGADVDDVDGIEEVVINIANENLEGNNLIIIIIAILTVKSLI